MPSKRKIRPSKKIRPLTAELRTAVDEGSFENKHERNKQFKRRIAWRWNIRLLLVSLPLMFLILAACFVSYRYHSSIIGGTFLSRAKVAEAEGDFEEQLKWLSRYSMLEPDDVEGVVNVALTANQLADDAEFENRSRATQLARKRIGDAIGRLGSENSDEKSQLRKLLINRLLQSGAYRYREAEENIVKLAPPDHDRQATKWMALALAGQVSEGIYEPRSSTNIPQGAGHWRKLAFRKPGEVLFEALRYSPDDVHLLQTLVSMADKHPELFEYNSEGDAESQRLELQQRIGEKLLAIKDNEDSRSKIVLFSFDKNCGQPLLANARLEANAEKVKQRLLQPDSSQDSSQDQAWNTEVGQSPPVFWDHLLLARIAMNLSEQNPELAMSYYEVLNKVDSKWIPKSYRETEFLLAGRLAFKQGDIPEALQVFQQGVESLPESIRLRGAIAQIAVDLRRQTLSDPSIENVFPDAELALEDFRKTINSNFVSLSSPKKEQAMNTSRAELADQIEIARWRLNVLEAKVESTKGEVNAAIEKLEYALNAQIEVDSNERVSVALELADLHERNGTSDLAALALERAIEISPENLKIRALAAEAWKRSGHFERAGKQGHIVGKRPVDVAQRADVDSLLGRISSCEIRCNDQFRRLSSERDFSGLRIWIEELKEDVQLALSVVEHQDSEKLKEVESRLVILSASMPSRGSVELEDSEESWSELMKLAQQRQDDPRFQAYAARRLASAQRYEAAEQAVLRLEQTVGEDRIESVVARAQLEASKGNPLESAAMLSQFASRCQDPATAERVLQTSASYALAGGDRVLAYQTLQNSPALGRKSLFTLCRIASNLSPDSSVVKDSNQTVEQLQNHWYQKLREVEGETGSLWRFLDAKKILAGLLSRSQPASDDQELTEAKKHIDEIIKRRPRWGEAISLEGWLLAVEGNPEAAVERIRVGIVAGDQMLQSRDLLIKLLLRLDRVDEVEAEILAAKNKYKEGFDPDSRGLILVEQKRGDFIQSSEIAQSTANSKPDDLMAQIVCAQTAIVAVKNLDDEQQKQVQVSVAQQAIGRAETLAGPQSGVVLSSKLSLELAQGNTAGVMQVIKAVGESKLEPMKRIALMSRGYVQLGEYQQALPLLLEAEKLKPTSQTQLAIAKVHKALNQPNQEIDALRLAQKRDPKNSQLRNKLAVALATRDGREVDFGELNRLLRNTDHSTSDNRFVHAILLGSIGDGHQAEKAVGVLRAIIQEENALSQDAARVLALMLSKQVKELKDSTSVSPDDTQQLQDLSVEIRTLYNSLISSAEPAPVDLYRFANFLIDHGQERDLARVKTILRTLKASKDGTMADLEIGVRYALKTGRRDDVPKIVSDWADREEENKIIPYGRVCSIAGQTLARVGFIGEATNWIGKAYELDAKMFATYVVALNRAGQFEKALDVCVKFHLKNSKPGTPDRSSLILLSETVIGAPIELITEQHQQLLNGVVAEKIKQPSLDDVPLFESVATWEMKRLNYERSVFLYHMIDRLEREQGNRSGTERIRTLNNLAMAYSELPGRESGGIEPIGRAIDLARKNMPQALTELLDTQGVVYLRSGNLAKAENAFRQCTESSKDPRFSFHLMLALKFQEKDRLAQEVWSRLDFKRLEANLQGLTHREKLELKQLKQEYREIASTLVQGDSQ